MSLPGKPAQNHASQESHREEQPQRDFAIDHERHEQAGQWSRQSGLAGEKPGGHQTPARICTVDDVGHAANTATPLNDSKIASVSTLASHVQLKL